MSETCGVLPQEVHAPGSHKHDFAMRYQKLYGPTPCILPKGHEGQHDPGPEHDPPKHIAKELHCWTSPTDDIEIGCDEWVKWAMREEEGVPFICMLPFGHEEPHDFHPCNFAIAFADKESRT